jgi:hypothetical protein
MPKKNMSLTSGLTRYHRIGSPTDPMRVLLDRPLECALCHGDKTVEQVTTDMERLWSKKYDRDTLRALYGSLDENVLVATAARGKPHEQAVALRLMGEARRKDGAALAFAALSHPYPLVRGYARDALVQISGTPCAIDLYESAERVRDAATKCAPFLDKTGLIPRAAPPPLGPSDDADDGED